jgi:hypothetical protein
MLPCPRVFLRKSRELSRRGLYQDIYLPRKALFHPHHTVGDFRLAEGWKPLEFTFAGDRGGPRIRSA